MTSNCRRSVHPHARGERRASSRGFLSGGGSSPRPWGTRSRRPPAAPLAPVHPHARGERLATNIWATGGTGSSPRPWGTRQPRRADRRRHRFIPTPVGNASGCPATAARPSVHPHARGERKTKLAEARQTTGSSPRPWGTQRRRRPPQGKARFIPTPVGNALPDIGSQVIYSVHPHARGEREMIELLDFLAAGSSPRPWGTPAGGRRDQADWRFIPTPVGNAPRARSRAR